MDFSRYLGIFCSFIGLFMKVANYALYLADGSDFYHLQILINRPVRNFQNLRREIILLGASHIIASCEKTEYIYQVRGHTLKIITFRPKNNPIGQILSLWGKFHMIFIYILYSAFLVKLSSFIQF